MKLPARRRLLIGAPAVVGCLAAGGFAAWPWVSAGGDGVGSATAQTVPPIQRDGKAAAAPHRFSLTLDGAAPGTPVNRRVLGSNVEWIDNGDDMLAADGKLDAAMLAMAQRLGPTVLRYPGGAQSDGYHWERGVGDLAARGPNNHVNAGAKVQQPTRMGTREFLELCEATGAEPLITVNVVTGSADEAARWLRATNITGFTSSVTGKRLPKVATWEIGNEPYLKQESRPELDLAPDEFARRANAFIGALRAVDASVKIGLPLTQDVRNGVPVTPYPGFTRTVLKGLTERFDFAAIHNAYLPFGLDAPRDAARQSAFLYWGAMAGAHSVQDSLAAMRALLAELRPGGAGAGPTPIAITEYNALFTLGAGDTDGWITTPAGALYVADALRVFAATPELLLANQWSLSGNWKFGAIHSGKYPRPVYEAMRLVGEALRGELLPAPASSVETVATAKVGLVAAQAALPLVEAMATRETTPNGRTLRLLLIHKDPTREGIAQVQLDAASVGAFRSARLTRVSGGSVLDARDVAGVMTRSEVAGVTPSSEGKGSAFELSLPPCSLALLHIELAPL